MDAAGNESAVSHISAVLDNTGPSPSSITAPANATYNLTQNVDFTVTFNDNVTVTGTPRLRLNVNGNTRYANYNSGSGNTALTFRYDTQNGDEDTDGIGFASTSIDLNSGTMRDSLGNNATLNLTSMVPSLTGVRIDAKPPTISGLTNDSTAKKTKSWSWSCSETCTYRSTVNTTSNTNPTGNYSSTATASQTSGTGTYYLHVQAKDSAGNESTVSHISAVLDNSGPTPSSITAPANATYNLTQNVDFVFNFNENVTVTGTPRLSLTVGSATRYAAYHSGSGSSALTFRYDTQANDEDTDGIAFAANSIDLNSGTLKDSLGNAATLSFSSIVPTLTGVKVDTVPPTISGLSNDGTAKKTKSWSWSCSETCTYRSTVDTTSNTNPTGTYSSTATASQTSGDGTYYLHVQAKDSAGNESTVSHVSAVLDNTGPSPSSMSGPSNGTYNLTQNVDFTITFDEAVTVTGTPRLSLTVGSATKYANYTSGSTTTTLTFRYDTASGDEDTDGIAFSATSIDLNSGTLKDSLGNDATRNFNSIKPTLSSVNIDAKPPTLSGLSNDSSAKKEQDLDMVVLRNLYLPLHRQHHVKHQPHRKLLKHRHRHPNRRERNLLPSRPG